MMTESSKDERGFQLMLGFDSVGAWKFTFLHCAIMHA